MSKEIYEKKFVKITNSNGICWYSNKINEMFYVIDKEKETNISCRYNVISNDDSMAGNGIYEHDCEEISLKQLIQRNHTECTTREDITYIVVGDSMYNNKGEYLKLQPYSDDLKDETNTNFDIIKITYKDEVLWERQEKKRIEDKINEFKIKMQ